MDNLITLNNVSFAYESDEGTNEVMRDLSVSFEKGRFTAVLGHNGSGKSTLARLLNGLLVPNKGTVTVNGMQTDDEKNDIAIKRTVGMVFQNPDNQLVATVVDEDVAFGLENLGVPHDEMVKRVADALKAVGMSDYAKSAPHKLSGGQLPGKQDIHQQEIGKQLVEHIPAHRAQGEQPKVSLAISIRFVHSNTLLFTCLCIIYYNFQQIATGKFMPPLYTGPKFDYNQTENHRFCSRSSGNCPGTAL